MLLPPQQGGGTDMTQELQDLLRSTGQQPAQPVSNATFHTTPAAASLMLSNDPPQVSDLQRYEVKKSDFSHVVYYVL